MWGNLYSTSQCLLQSFCWSDLRALYKRLIPFGTLQNVCSFSGEAFGGKRKITIGPIAFYTIAYLWTTTDICHPLLYYPSRFFSLLSSSSECLGSYCAGWPKHSSLNSFILYNFQSVYCICPLNIKNRHKNTKRCQMHSSQKLFSASFPDYHGQLLIPKCHFSSCIIVTWHKETK